MANSEHISLLSTGIEGWNAWRVANPQLRPDLSGYDFTKIKPIYWEDPSGNQHATQLWHINLRGADLRGAILIKQELFEADLSISDLQNAVLNDAIIKFSDLRGANLRNANLKGARLIFADLREADLTGAAVFGISPWDVNLENAIQKNLIITPSSAPEITVDNLDLAQSIYALHRNHKKIRDVIDTIGQRAILLLGRFTPDRKEILDTIAEKLRDLKFLPIIFDFDPIPIRDFTETIEILAGFSKFIIADITQPKSVPQEAHAIISHFKVPFISIIQEGEQPWSMSGDLNLYDWVIGPISYPNKSSLIENLERIIVLAEEKNKEINSRRANRQPKIKSIEEL